MDLEAMKKRAKILDPPTYLAPDVLALVAEVERLKAALKTLHCLYPDDPVIREALTGGREK